MTNQSHGQNHRTPTPWLKWKRRRRRQLPGRASAGPLNTPASLDIRAVLPPEPSLATPWPSDPAPCVCHGGALSSLGRCQGASRGLARMERQTPCRRVSRQGAGRQRRTQRSRMCGTGPGGLAAQVETGSRPAVGVLPPAVELTAGSRQALFSERRPWSRVGWEGAPGRAAHLGSCSPWGSGWRAGLGRPFRLEPVSARQPHVPAWSLRPRTTLMTVTCTASSCGNPLTASRPLQTDVLHQNIYDYIHVDDRQDFRRQLHWAMDPPHAALGRPLRSEAAEDAALGRLLRAQEGGAGSPAEYSAFLTRCFVCRVRCLLDSTSGFLAMQFQGKLKFLFGQKRKAPSGTALPPRLSLFCTAAPALLPSTAETKVKSTFLKLKHGADISALTDARAKAQSQCEPESHVKPNHSAGRNSAENGLSVFRAQTDGDRWAQLPARATCPCLRGGPDSVLDPRVASGGGAGEGRGRAPGGSSTARWRREGHAYDRHLEAAGPAQQLHWMTGALGQEGGTRLKLEPSMGGPFPGQAGAQGIVHTDSFTASASPCPRGAWRTGSLLLEDSGLRWGATVPRTPSLEANWCPPEVCAAPLCRLMCLSRWRVTLDLMMQQTATLCPQARCGWGPLMWSRDSWLLSLPGCTSKQSWATDTNSVPRTWGTVCWGQTPDLAAIWLCSTPHAVPAWSTCTVFLSQSRPPTSVHRATSPQLWAATAEPLGPCLSSSGSPWTHPHGPLTARVGCPGHSPKVPWRH
ncbi:aryl hydrocarbon receptor repressor isoform X2 [Manis pentadactyla]|uniref:aryl hydrocarbon receptor repressor isoform X2 n=1 Tax=Manis pentadactyla TaxID=143292 RepID=UPI00255CC939|nr:aryl hydrocarbon receptor repressor isoform X2 [Manis pentadactyla]